MSKKQGKAMEVYNEVKFMEEFAAGDNVKFAPSHALAGTLGKVAALNADGTIGVMVGKALQAPVSPAELIKVEIDNGKRAPAGAPGEVSTGPAAVAPATTA